MTGRRGHARGGLAVLGAVLLASCTPTGGPSRTTSAPTRSTVTSYPSEKPTTHTWSVATENTLAGSPGWQIGRVAGRTPGLEAFADEPSVRPGVPIHLRISAAGAVRLRAIRLGWYGGVGGRQVWSGTAIARPQRPADEVNTPLTDIAGAPGATHMITAPWARTTTVDTRGWPEGHYVLRLDHAGAARFVPVTISSPDLTGRLVFVTAPMTWQAYNTWGGRSLYKGRDGALASRSLAVSFQRPYLEGYGAGHLLYREAPLLQVAEKAGLPLAYVTDLDLAQTPRLLNGSGASGLVFGAHSEYWTAPERSAIQRAVDAGLNLAVFGANTAYWRVRVTPAGRPPAVFGAKEAGLDPAARVDPRGATARFRSAPSGIDEQRLFGQVYDCFPARGDWIVSDPAWWGYAGTGLTRGSRLRGVLGPETDRLYARPGRLAPSQIVGYSPLSCAGGKTWSTGVYSTNAAGAGIFAAGTMGWVPALRPTQDAATAAVLSQITTTILTAFATPRAGATHPATDTVARFQLPPTQTTSYAG